MITYQPESVADVADEITPLLEAHYLEIATNKAIKPLDIDWERYYELEKLGALRILTARENLVVEYVQEREAGKLQGQEEVMMVERGPLIGYFITFITHHLHYQQTVSAVNDVFYVTPDQRRGSMGYRLILEACTDLKNLNADILTIHMKTDYPFRNLLVKAGFELVEENWEKVL